MLRFTVLNLGGKAGVPKRKHPPNWIHSKKAGVEFKHNHLRLQAWYYCPLCSEPKQQGTTCRREDCRQLKP